MTAEWGGGPDVDAVVNVARRVSARWVGDEAARWDQTGQMPSEVVEQIGAAGLLGLDVDPRWGGQGAGSVAAGRVAEELSAAEYCLGALVVQAGSGARLLARAEDPELAELWVPRIVRGETTVAFGLTEAHSGSDLGDLRVRARSDAHGWVIRGEKTSVSNPRSKIVVVLAATDEGPSLFLVRNSDAIGIQALDDMGARALGRAVMTFDEVPPEDVTLLVGGRQSIRDVFGALVTARLIVAMTALGVGRAAHADAVAWAAERETFGQPLSHRQGVAFPAVDAEVEIELSRLLCLRGLTLADAGKGHDREAAMAKAWIPPRMVGICRWALLVSGHLGYTREHVAQRRLRDVIGTELGEGPTNVQRILLARRLFGVSPS